jgi:hypothetical protein
LALGILAFVVIGVMTAWRFGLFTTRYQSNALERFASAAGYRMTEDRTGITAIVDGLPIAVRMVVTPSDGAPTTTWTVSAPAADGVQGRVSLRPEHEDEAAGLRLGDVDFDTCFYVEGTSRGLASAILDDAVRRALFAFGPRGTSSYDHGAATLEWESHERARAERGGSNEHRTHLLEE